MPTTRKKLKSIQAEAELDAAEVLHQYEESYLECRNLRHAWKVVGYFREGGEVRQRLACMRCPTEVTARWSPRGDRIARSYSYPDGYCIKGSHVTPYDVRVEVLQRVTIFNTEGDMLQTLFSGRGRKKVS